MIHLRKSSILIFLSVLLLCAVFETLQQYYYIRRFQLNQVVHLGELFFQQLYRWLIWGGLSFILYRFIKVYKQEEEGGLGERFLLKLFSLIIALVILNIVLIGTISWLINGEFGDIGILFSEYLPFFTFQKVPIFTFGYLAVAAIFYLDKENSRLHFEIQSLHELQQQERQKYQQLQDLKQDNPLLLNIKVGNKHKIIAIEDIYFLEADDYCVKVFSTSERAYTMRATLKSMEQKLPPHFFRVHRKYLVNTKCLKEISQQQGYHLLLKNGSSIPVAKNRIGGLKAFLASF